MSVSLVSEGPWTKVLEDSLSHTLTAEKQPNNKFFFETVLARFVKLEVLDVTAGSGAQGGLRFFEVFTGCSSVYTIESSSKDYEALSGDYYFIAVSGVTGRFVATLK